MQKITELTRRDLIDLLILEKVSWSGRLGEVEFLSRIYDLSKIKSTDRRYKSAVDDIQQHRINNYDWDDHWVYFDARFELQWGDDQILLRFLCEMLHPVVRNDIEEVESLLRKINKILKNDGYVIQELTRISGKPIFSARLIEASNQISFESIKKIIHKKVDFDYISQQITRMEAAVYDDPDLAIGTAKELIETCCKTILKERNIIIDTNLEIPKLVKQTASVLDLTPNSISSEARGFDSIKRILSNLSSIANSLAELRNEYGTGHGKVATTKGLNSRHAKLAVGASATLVVFLFETHYEKVKNE